MAYFSALFEPSSEERPQPLIMGIVNITPDSFSDGGLAYSEHDAIGRAEKLTVEGAALIDLGAESTAPEAKPVSLEEELRRLRPVVTALARKMALSIDTFKAPVAEEMLTLGAKVVNDVSGLRADEHMVKVVAGHHASLIIMHSKEQGSHPHVTESARDYQDVVREVAAFLMERAEYAVRAGVSERAIALDPGMGRFLSHDPKYSWELLRRYDELVEMLKPFPVVVATSRKGFLGGALATRDPISQLTALRAVQRGAKIVRTHAPGMMKQFLDTW
jgi:dihydropteroate synthase